jgi:hypothetical protein
MGTRRVVLKGASRYLRGPHLARWTLTVPFIAVTSALFLLVMVASAPDAYAAEASVGLGTASAYSVLGGQAVTNTGPTTLSGDLGVSPGTAITGFPPGTVSGATYAGDAQAAKAQSDLVTGYKSAAGRTTTSGVAGDLVGKTLTSGVYTSSGPIALSGTLTLNGQGNPDAVFVFQIASTLITASSSDVSLTNGAQACNVFWQVGSSATLGTDSNFTGTIMALTSITVTTDTVVKGRALARNGAVTLDDDRFVSPSCNTTPRPTSTTTSGATTTTTATTPSGTTTATTTPTGGGGSGIAGGGPNGSVGSGPTGSLGKGSVLPMTGAGPWLMAFFGAGVVLILVGCMFVATGRSRRRSLELQRSP